MKKHHHLTHSEEVEGGMDSHMHHKKEAMYHHKEMKKHIDKLSSMAKAAHKSHHMSKKK